MTTIPIKVSGKVAVCTKKYLISANSDYELEFQFDSSWDNVSVKTARLIFDAQSISLPFTGSRVALPKIPACQKLVVGVFSETLATTAADIGCVVSIADIDAEDAGALTESQYERLVALLNEAKLRQIDTLTKEDDTVIVRFTDGTADSFLCADGVSVTAAQIDDSGCLTLTLSNGSVLSCGNVRGAKGDPGDKGDPFTYEDFTTAQLDALASSVLERLESAEGGSY